MKEHLFILLLFGFSLIVLSVLFYFIYKSSLIDEHSSRELSQSKKKRFQFFFFLLVLLLIGLMVSIPKSPYFKYSKDIPAKIIHAAAMQYVFLLSSQSIDMNNLASEEIIVPQGKVVEFRVTSLDVTHGFGIYNNDNQLITQTQAMPGYVNRLRWKFDEPGEYQILCLEFCGTGHAFMRSTFTVK